MSEASGRIGPVIEGCMRPADGQGRAGQDSARWDHLLLTAATKACE